MRAGGLQAFALDAIFPSSIVYRKSTLVILLALIFLCFFGTLALSASMFPQNYDWRNRVISNLLSPRDNPDRYWIAALGLGLSGILMPALRRIFAAFARKGRPTHGKAQRRRICAWNYYFGLRMCCLPATHARNPGNSTTA